MSPTSTVGVGFGANLANDGPPDLPTQERTEDVEAWRERMDARREEARGHRDVIQAGHAAETAVTVRPRPVVKPRPPLVRAPWVDLTTQRRASVVTAYLAGDSTVVLAARYEVTPTTIGNWLKAAGVTLRPSGGQHRRAAQDTTGPAPAPEPVPGTVGESPELAVVDEPALAPEPAPVADAFAGHRVNGAQVMRDRLVAAGVTAAQLRQWAREQGRTVPSHGAPSAALLADCLAVTMPLERVAAEPEPSVDPGLGSRYVTAAESREIVAAYVAGQTAVEIASAHHRNPATVRKAVRDAGVPVRDERSIRSGGRVKVDDPAVVDAVRRLYEVESLTQAQVGERLGMGTHAVQKLMGRNGIESRPDVTGATVGPRPPAPRVVRYLPSDTDPRTVELVTGMTALAAANPSLGVTVDPAALLATLATEPDLLTMPAGVWDGAAMVPAPRTCRVCGCTDDDACEGGCWWVDADLCSACSFPGHVAAHAIDVDAVLRVPVVDVAAALQGVAAATEQLLDAQRAVALMRVQALHRLTSELLAVLDHPTTTGARP